MRCSVALAALLCSVALQARADAPTDAVTWLQRIVSASQKLNYAGTFVYQNGKHAETSRVIHVVDGAVERERLEVLDGSPREVVRQDDEVRCFLPEERTVIIDRQARHKLLPARMPEALANLPQYYEIRSGKPGRVAGFDAQMIILEPKDKFRFGHWLWAERSSGLLLKARMVNGRGEPMEQFAFTQLQIGGNIDRDALQSRFVHQAADWQQHNSQSSEVIPDNGDWVFRGEVPGFKRNAGVRRQIGPGARDTIHYLFSDGMATISVFIERMPAGAVAARDSHYRSGATNVVRVVLGEQLVTAVGEVPVDTLRIIAAGIEPRRK